MEVRYQPFNSRISTPYYRFLQIVRTEVFPYLVEGKDIANTTCFNKAYNLG